MAAVSRPPEFVITAELSPKFGQARAILTRQVPTIAADGSSDGDEPDPEPPNPPGSSGAAIGPSASDPRASVEVPPSNRETSDPRIRTHPVAFPPRRRGVRVGGSRPIAMSSPPRRPPRRRRRRQSASGASHRSRNRSAHARICRSWSSRPSKCCRRVCTPGPSMRARARTVQRCIIARVSSGWNWMP